LGLFPLTALTSGAAAVAGALPGSEGKETQHLPTLNTQHPSPHKRKLTESRKELRVNNQVSQRIVAAGCLLPARRATGPGNRTPRISLRTPPSAFRLLPASGCCGLRSAAARGMRPWPWWPCSHSALGLRPRSRSSGSRRRTGGAAPLGVGVGPGGRWCRCTGPAPAALRGEWKGGGPRGE
jgi:hypothetical protein